MSSDLEKSSTHYNSFFLTAVNDDHVQQCGMPLMNFKGVGVENKYIVANRREKSEVNIDIIIFLQLMVLKSGFLFSASLVFFFLKSDSENLLLCGGI